MRKIAAERRCRKEVAAAVVAATGTEGGCERLRELARGENRRWVKNCGERWEGKSDEFFLLAFCLRAATGCPDDYDYSRRVAGASACVKICCSVESFRGIDKDWKSGDREAQEK